MAIPRALRGWLCALAFFVAAGPAAAEVAVPALKARVTDLTGTLDAGERAALERTLADFEAKKGAQVAVLLLPTTQPETIEQYAVRVFEQWKLGRKGVDDGVLLVVAKDDRRLRIEVGYGLEGILPDAIAKRIISEDIAPRFKQGDFAGGLRAGVTRILGVIDGEKLPPPQPQRSTGEGGWSFSDLLFAGFFAVAFLGNLLRGIFGRVPGALIGGGVVGFGALLLSGHWLIGLALGVIAFLLLLIAGSGTGGGWSSGGGFDSGGFSGGGGSSGGGGASGSW